MVFPQKRMWVFYHMYRINEIKELLRIHDYIPIVRKIGDGILIKLPRAKLLPKPLPALFYAYAVKRGKGAGLFHNSSKSSEEKFTSVPEYAIRLFLMSDVSACCSRIPISDSLVCFLDEEGKEQEKIENIVEPPSNGEDQNKEGFLTTLIMEARRDNFPCKYEEVALTHDVHEGYRLLKTFFEV